MSSKLQKKIKIKNKYIYSYLDIKPFNQVETLQQKFR